MHLFLQAAEGTAVKKRCLQKSGAGKDGSGTSIFRNGCVADMREAFYDQEELWLEILNQRAGHALESQRL